MYAQSPDINSVGLQSLQAYAIVHFLPQNGND